MSLGVSDLINIFGLLLDSALKGILLVAAAAIAAYLLRTRFAAARHAAWTAAVVGHLALPAVTLLAPAWRLPFLPAPPWLATQVTTVSQSSASVVSSFPTPDSSSIITSPSPAPANAPSAAVTPAISKPFHIDRLSLLAALWVA